MLNAPANCGRVGVNALDARRRSRYQLLKSLRRFEPDQVGAPWLAQVGSEPEDEPLAEHRFLDDAVAVLFAAGQGVLVFVCHYQPFKQSDHCAAIAFWWSETLFTHDRNVSLGMSRLTRLQSPQQGTTLLS
jgi:hypothetical protein